MQEIKNQNNSIILPLLPNFALKVVAFLNHLLVFLQLREKRQYWGIVYDSVTKQPLDPVKVSLIYADSGKVESTCLTDMEGHYGFLARPGKFKIFVQRTNYAFPSQVVRGDKDGIYTRLYHGEFFELNEASEVVAPNIPMDPLGVDWNQQVKQRLMRKSFYAQWFLEKLISVFLWFGFVYFLAVAIASRLRHTGAVMATLVYFGVFIVELVTPNLRLWGRVRDTKTLQPILGLELSLRNPKVPGVIFGKALSREDGKFFLRAKRGRYSLEVRDPQSSRAFGSLPVKIGREGVLNAEVRVDFF